MDTDEEIAISNENNNIIRGLTIKGYQYKFKDKYNTGYCYRCINRKDCKLTILIKNEEYIKIKEKKIYSDEITYTVNSIQQTHTCIVKKIETVENNKIMTEKEEYNLAILLIKNNIDKKPQYHINKLRENNIFWKRNKIIRLVYTLQEEIFPVDKNFMNQIQNQTINLEGNNSNLNNYKLCPRQIIINDLYNKYNDHLIFFTTIFQLKLIKESNYLFIDGTFRSCPNTHKQILNILGYINTKNLTMPIASIMMRTKNENSYYTIFENIKVMLNELKLVVDFKKIYIYSDFEKSLRNALKRSFPETPILGCYFHYIKCLFDKFKSLSLMKKKNIKVNLKILFFFKLFPFLYKEDQQELLKNIIDAYSCPEDKFDKKIYLFIIYYIKNWYGNEAINYVDLTDNKFTIRTNNKVENFHLLLNNIIEHNHPKFAYFVEKYKILIKLFYEKYIDNLHNIDDEEINKVFIADDITNFIIKLTEKYKSKVTFKILAQLEKDDELKLFEIINYMIKLLYEEEIENDLILNDKKGETNENNDDNESDEEINYTEDDKKEEFESLLNNGIFDKKKLKEKLYEIANKYYNSNHNNFDDSDLNFISNKKKSDEYINKYIGQIEEIINAKQKKKYDKRYKKYHK